MGLCRVREGEGASGGSKVPTRRSLSRPRSESARQALCHDSHALIRSLTLANTRQKERTLTLGTVLTVRRERGGIGRPTHARGMIRFENTVIYSLPVTFYLSPSAPLLVSILQRVARWCRYRLGVSMHAKVHGYTV